MLNSSALTAASILNAVLGLAFWTVSAREYPAALVGIASITITSSLGVSSFSNLSIGAVYERFLPIAGIRTFRFTKLGLAVTAGSALVAGAVLAIALDLTGKVLSGSVAALMIPLWVLILGLFAMLDNLANALGVGRWAAVKNVVHSAAKLLLVLVLGTVSPRSESIVVSWMIPAAVVTIVTGALLCSRARVISGQNHMVTAMPQRREVVTYSITSYALQSLNNATPLVVPIAIIMTLNPSSNAYFSVTWAVVSAVFLLMMILVGPFVSEAVSHPDASLHLTTRFAIILVVVAAGGAIGLAVAGRSLLGMLGGSYERAGTPLLLLGAATLPFMAVNIFYGALARLQRRLRLAVASKLISTLVTIGGAFVLADRIGLAGVGYAYLVGEIAATALVAIPLLRMLADFRRTFAG